MLLKGGNFSENKDSLATRLIDNARLRLTALDTL
jgi:hypothetical protein